MTDGFEAVVNHPEKTAMGVAYMVQRAAVVPRHIYRVKCRTW